MSVKHKTGSSSLTNTELALLEAIITFNRIDGEGSMCIELKGIAKNYKNGNKSYKQIEDYLKRFKKLYMLRFNFPTENSKDWRKLINTLGCNYIPMLFSNSKVSDVDTIANRIKVMGLSSKSRLGNYKKLTSFASKLAFTAKPNKFWIYDKTVRKSFSLGNNCDYATLYNECEKRFQVFVSNINSTAIFAHASKDFKKIISSNKFKAELDNFRTIAKKIGIKKDDEIMNLLNRRLFDKHQMINGGFKKESLRTFKTGFLSNYL